MYILLGERIDTGGVHAGRYIARNLPELCSDDSSPSRMQLEVDVLTKQNPWSAFRYSFFTPEKGSTSKDKTERQGNR
jgi:hypothetical protein